MTPDPRLVRRLSSLSADQRAALVQQMRAGVDASGRELRAPLSADQHRMWRMEQGRPAAAAHVVAAGVSVRGPLVVDALRAAAADVVARHEILRTHIETDGDGRPVQVISPEGEMEVSLHVLDDVEPDAREAAADEILRQVARRPFDFAGVLTRLPIVRLGADHHVFALVQHHIVSDWISYGTLMDELLAGYAARLAGDRLSLPAPSLQYRQWVARQEEMRATGAHEAALEHLATDLRGANTSVTLPTAHAPASERFEGRRLWFTLPQEVQTGLGDVARRHRATLFMGIVAVLKRWLGEAAGSEDVVVGAPSANRGDAPADLLGLLLQPLVLHTRVGSTDSFAQTLEAARTGTLDRMMHAGVPFADLVRRVAPTRFLDYHPLFRVRYLFLDWPPPAHVAGLKITPFDVDPHTSLHDLTVSIWSGPLGLFGRFEYDVDRYDEPQVRAAMERFSELLCGAAGVAYPGDAVVPERTEILRYFDRLDAPVSREGTKWRFAG